MHFEIDVAGRTRRITVARVGAAFAVTVDGRTRHVDAARIDAQTLSLVVDNVWPHDVIDAPERRGQLTVTVNGTPVPVSVNGRRRAHHDEASAAGAGPQRLAAPMSGKVVRLLVRQGDSVETRQPIVVVEAMKMENELRASRGGTVSDVHVREGQLVDAGSLLVTIL